MKKEFIRGGREKESGEPSKMSKREADFPPQ